MYKGKIAVKNPGNGGYRIPAEHLGDVNYSSNQLFIAFLGTVTDRIGTYEDCETLEEMNKARKRFGVPEIKK